MTGNGSTARGQAPRSGAPAVAVGPARPEGLRIDGRDVSVPFDLPLAGPRAHDEAVRCRRVVRHLPGRRLVCQGSWAGEEVFVKIYLDPRRRRRDHQREMQGLAALGRGGLAVPSVLFSGVEADQGYPVLVLRAIRRGALSARELLEASGAGRERTELLSRLVGVLARQHDLGVVQRDLHLDNFLIEGDCVYTLDGGGVEVRRGPVGRRRSLRHLGLLFAQVHPEPEERVREVFARYAALRGWRTDRRLLSQLGGAIEHAARARARELIGKLYRNCTQIAVREGFGSRLAYVRDYDSAAMRRFLENPSATLDSPESRVLKLGNSATVWLTEVDGHRLVVKRYNIKDPIHGLRRALRRTRASRSWESAHLLRAFGVAAPRPVALREERWGPVRRVSYFVAEQVAGADCREVLCEAAQAGARRAEAVSQVKELFRRLGRLRMSHGDMKASNLRIAEGRAVLLDLDAMRRHRSRIGAVRALARDVARFLENWRDEPELQGALRELLEHRRW